ncbi:hypothetical protein GQ600_23782 [Phytophthora cactorum]|nr:hypothetical protein GQ600_23782 [Phytophthora cactorum]
MGSTRQLLAVPKRHDGTSSALRAAIKSITKTEAQPSRTRINGTWRDWFPVGPEYPQHADLLGHEALSNTGFCVHDIIFLLAYWSKYTNDQFWYSHSREFDNCGLGLDPSIDNRKLA